MSQKTTINYYFTLALLLTACNINSQNTSVKKLLTSSELVYQENYSVQNIDSLYNDLKEQAKTLQLDSLYIVLTFQQIEKHGGVENYQSAELLLENIIINNYTFLKQHPRLLLECYRKLGLYYLLQHNTSNAAVILGKEYFKNYFDLIKTLELTPEEKVKSIHSKLEYLLKTKNDSLFYYLNASKLPENKKALYLSEWYHTNSNHEKEFVFAKKTGDSVRILRALAHNREFEKVDQLYAQLINKLKVNDPDSEHMLYLYMGKRYLAENKFSTAISMLNKALYYFESHKSHQNYLKSIGGLIEIYKTQKDFQNYSLYTTMLLEYKDSHLEQQINVLKDHISYEESIKSLELKLANEDKLLKAKKLETQVNFQKTLISFAFGFMIVTLVFVFFYFQSQKSRSDLVTKNTNMRVNVLRSKFKPHFVFNILSVINYFVAKKELENASKTISKMSSLLRSTLDNMNKKLVSFESEYKICKNYMFLEHLRFSNKFDYRFKPLTQKHIKEWKIPPGLIEPLLENCVNHAFKGVRKKGEILLDYYIDNNVLVIIIKDNGVGLKNTLSNIPDRESHGLRITRDYIQASSKLYHAPISIDFIEDNGTTVEVRIPNLEERN